MPYAQKHHSAVHHQHTAGQISLQKSFGPHTGKVLHNPDIMNKHRSQSQQVLHPGLPPSVRYAMQLWLLTTEPHHALPSRRLRRSEEHTSELQSRGHLVCRLLLEKKNYTHGTVPTHA